MAAHQAPPSLGFFRQEHWSGLPFPSPMHESDKIESEVAQTYPTLWDPMDCSLTGSSVHWISQARVLEWVPSPSLIFFWPILILAFWDSKDMCLWPCVFFFFFPHITKTCSLLKNIFVFPVGQDFSIPAQLTFGARSLVVLCGKGFLCVVRCLAASLTSTTRCHKHSLPVVTTKMSPNVSKYLLLSLFIHYVVSESLWSHGLQRIRLPCPSLSPRICSDSWTLGQWCYLAISFSATLFSCFQSFPALGSFPRYFSKYLTGDKNHLQLELR